ncbi:hypothetical protein WJX72_000169 [[Myrmecia] bisecta]|uniref:Uncharacterized protein n=1 Tax=[Myrmecia] bisecta TaxID=41462 RepID=A0AAW1R4G2_9CHLO
MKGCVLVILFLAFLATAAAKDAKPCTKMCMKGLTCVDGVCVPVAQTPATSTQGLEVIIPELDTCAALLCAVNTTCHKGKCVALENKALYMYGGSACAAILAAVMLSTAEPPP